jgi:hypothetical protein
MAAKEFRRDFHAILEKSREFLKTHPPVYFAQFTGLTLISPELVSALADGICSPTDEMYYFGGQQSEESTDYAVSMFFGYKPDLERGFSAVRDISGLFCDAVRNHLVKRSKETVKTLENLDDDHRAIMASYLLKILVDRWRSYEPELLTSPKIIAGAVALDQSFPPRIIFPTGKEVLLQAHTPELQSSMNSVVSNGKIEMMFLDTPILQATALVAHHLLENASKSATSETKPERATLPKTKDKTASPFIPTPFQKAILECLQNKGMRTDAIANKLGDRRKFFREKKELEEQGLLSHHKRVGFYSPVAPPPELANKLHQDGTKTPPK